MIERAGARPFHRVLRRLLRCRPAPATGVVLGAICLALLLGSPGHAVASTSNRSIPVRPYVRLARGRTFLTNPNAVADASLESPATNSISDISLGADLGPHLGFEFATDYVKTSLRSGSELLGDYSLWTLLLQSRLRFPLNRGRFVPYLLAGGGAGLGDFSGRQNFKIPAGGHGYSGVGAAGGGFDLFLAENVSVGVEAKYLFAFSPPVTVNGQKSHLTADNLSLTAGLRAYFGPEPANSSGGGFRPGQAKDKDGRHLFASMRLGTGFLTNTTDVKPAELFFDTRTGIMGGASVGLNLSRHWGTEFAFDYTRTQLRSPIFGKVTGYPIYTALLLARYRYPVMNDRLSPYLLFGGGVGFGEAGDADTPTEVTGFRAARDSSPVATAGIGFDYFIANNVAIGIESKYSFLYSTKGSFDKGGPVTLNPNVIELSTQLRAFFN